MVHYLGLILLVSASGVLYRRKRVYVSVVVIALVLFAGLRAPGVDRDYSNYFYLWYIGFQEPIYYLVEPLSKILFSIFSHFEFKYHVFLMAVALLSIGCKVLAAHRVQVHIPSFILIYCGYFYFQHDMTQIRLAIALGFVMLSFSQIGVSKIGAVSYFFFALCSHISVVLLFPMFFIGSGKDVLLWMLGLLLVLAASLLGFDLVWLVSKMIYILPIFDKYRALYFEGGFVDYGKGINVFSFTNILFFIMLIISCVHILTAKNTNKHYVIAFKMCVIGMAMIPALKSLPVASFRVSQVYLAFLPFMIAFQRQIYNDLLYKIIHYALVTLVALLLAYVVTDHSSILSEYQTIFDYSFY